MFNIVRPTDEYVPSHVEALERGWTNETVRGSVAIAEELTRIAADPPAFLRGQVDRGARNEPVVCPLEPLLHDCPSSRPRVGGTEGCRYRVSL
jgi:hypothetical protein